MRGRRVTFLYGTNWGKCVVKACPTETAQNVVITEGDNVSMTAKCCMRHRNEKEFRLITEGGKPKLQILNKPVTDFERLAAANEPF